MPPTQHLAQDVYATIVGDDVVILDAVRDRYLCLPGAAEGLRLEVTGEVVILAPALADTLRAERLICDRPAPAGRMPTPPCPRASAVRDAYASPRLADVLPAVRAVRSVAQGYAGQSFARIVRAARTAREASPAISHELIRAVDDFHRWIPYAPVSGKCLVRSYVLLRHLRRSGLDAVWVFGVRVWPFHAHCWLQVEDLVLDDQADRVRAYTPILAL